MKEGDAGVLIKLLRFTRKLVVVVVILPWAAKASAQSGREDYQHYHAACHGQDGNGKGEWNGTTVADLTRLSRNNGGRFPSEEVQKVVDGRSKSLRHQLSRDMLSLLKTPKAWKV